MFSSVASAPVSRAAESGPRAVAWVRGLVATPAPFGEGVVMGRRGRKRQLEVEARYWQRLQSGVCTFASARRRGAQRRVPPLPCLLADGDDAPMCRTARIRSWTRNGAAASERLAKSRLVTAVAWTMRGSPSGLGRGPKPGGLTTSRLRNGSAGDVVAFSPARSAGFVHLDSAGDYVEPMLTKKGCAWIFPSTTACR